MSNSNSIQCTIDPSSFYFLKPPSDLSNCPICLKQMEKNAALVGHIFKKTVLHCVHEKCWREYSKSLKNPNYLPCAICKTQFKASSSTAQIDQIELSPNGKDILFELGIDFTRLSLHQRSWYLNLPENRRKWIVEHCTPPIDFLCKEQDWLEKVSDEEIEWSLSVLPSLDRFIYKKRGGLFSSLFSKMMTQDGSNTDQWLNTNKKSWSFNQRKEFLTLLFDVRKWERIQKNLRTPAKIFEKLTVAEKGFFLGLFRTNIELYQAIVELTASFYLPDDQTWLKDPSATIPKDTPDALLIISLKIPHQKLSWKIGNGSGEEIAGSFRNLIISSELKNSEKGWLLNLTNPEKARIALLKSSALKLDPNDRIVFFNLQETRAKWITTFSGIPEVFIQKELVWLKGLEEEDLERSLALADVIPMMIDFLVKEEDLSQAKANLEIFLNMMTLQRFVNRLKTKRYDGLMDTSERIWLNNCGSNLKFFQSLIEQGIHSGIFCGEETRQLIRQVESKGGKLTKTEVELLQIAHKAYRPNGSFSFPDGKSIALGYLAGYAIAQITNSNNQLSLLAVAVAAVTLKVGIHDYDSFEKGDSKGKWTSKRSLKVGAAIATSAHTVGVLATNTFLLIGFGALFLVFVKILFGLAKGLENKRR